MLLKDHDESALEQAAANTPGVLLRDVRESPSENGIRFRLALDGESYRRLSPRNGRRVNAVCWHGHRDFLENLFLDYPDARVYTMIENYLSLDDFYRKFPETYYHNIGSHTRPADLGGACACGGPGE